MFFGAWTGKGKLLYTDKNLEINQESYLNCGNTFKSESQIKNMSINISHKAQFNSSEIWQLRKVQWSGKSSHKTVTTKTFI